MLTKAPPADIDAVVERVVRSQMGEFGFKSVKVSEGEDHDGDPILFVNIECAEPDVEVDVKVLAGLVSKLRSKLWKIGEERFPHVVYHSPAKQKIRGNG
jgi:hypothetical protein